MISSLTIVPKDLLCSLSLCTDHTSLILTKSCFPALCSQTSDFLWPRSSAICMCQSGSNASCNYAHSFQARSLISTLYHSLNCKYVHSGFSCLQIVSTHFVTVRNIWLRVNRQLVLGSLNTVTYTIDVWHGVYLDF